MFRSKFYHAETQRCKIATSIIFFLGVFLFYGCSPEPDFEELSPDGTWQTEYDSYIINLVDNTFEYYDGGYGAGYTGIILEIKKINNDGTAGIIFIEYITKPVDFDTGEKPAGDFIGVYYKGLTNEQGSFASPIEQVEGKYITPAKSTLEEAKNTFTENTTGNYISFWSACVKQQ